MEISVIIPVYNEEDVIVQTIRSIRRHADCSLLKEIIIVDGGSTDQSARFAGNMGVKVFHSPKGKAVQMNSGARRASGDILFFLHADSIPPKGFDREIVSTLNQGHQAGCFRLSFDDSHFLLEFYAWFTRFDMNAFRFGDQSLFITRRTFAETGGFREDHLVMEDNEMVRRIKGNYAFHIIPREITTSARKYRKVGVLKLQAVFILIYLGYQMGVSQRVLVSWYRRFISKGG